MADMDNILGERLKERRKFLNLTGTLVAAEVKIDNSTYANYEHGRRKPNNITLVKLANVLETSVDYLIGKIDDSSPVYNGDNLADILKDKTLMWGEREITSEEALTLVKVIETVLGSKDEINKASGGNSTHPKKEITLEDMGIETKNNHISDKNYILNGTEENKIDELNIRIGHFQEEVEDEDDRELAQRYNSIQQLRNGD